MKRNEHFDGLCHNSKNLYNQAMFIIRKHYDNTGKFLGYNKFEKIIKKTKNLENEINYYKLPAQTSQQILRLLEKNWKSYFNSLKDYRKHPEKYLGEPQSPLYLRRKRNILIFTNQTLHYKNNKLICKKFGIKIKIPQKDYKDFSKFQQVRFIPKGEYYQVEIVYNQKIIKKDTDKKRMLFIDLGINNLATLTTNFISKPIIINGRILKSVNQLFCKRFARLKSIRTNGKDNKKELDRFYFYNTKQMSKLSRERNNYIDNYLHNVSNFIVKYSLENKIGSVFVGDLSGIKQKINLGKKNNQNIQLIPIAKLKKQFQYKLKLIGIKCKEVKENYTSKCSALDLEKIRKHKKYIGKRVHRGLFISPEFGKINADVNGSLNIGRKVIGNTFIEKLVNSRVLYNPSKINILDNVDKATQQTQQRSVKLKNL
jgi:putative transposase